MKTPLDGRIPSKDAPLSFAQARLWFLDRMGAGAGYNLPFEIRLRGPLDVGSLERALGEIVRRHDILRTSFPLVGGEPVQRVDETQEIPLRRIDLSGSPVEDHEREAIAIADREARTPFDLSAGPLLRPLLLELGPDDHVFLMTKHHIVWDLWSTGIFYDELRRLYEAFRDDRPSPLPELAVQYRQFSVWQRERLTEARLERPLAHARKATAKLPPLELPTDGRRPPLLAYETSICPFELPPALTIELRELARRNEVTLAMLLLAAWQIVLARYAGETDVATGMLVANRTEVETEAMIGFFVNLLVVRTDLGGDPSLLDELLPRVKSNVLSAYDHQELPFEKLVEALNPTRDTSRHPIVQTLFTLQLTPAKALELGGIECTTLGDPEGGPALARPETIRSPFDLELRVVDRGDKLRGHLVNDPRLFSEASAAAMTHRYRTLLARIAATPRARLSELCRLDANERRRVLPTPSRSPIPSTLAVGRFERRADETPERVAVRFGDDALTYRQLDRRANRLAHRLLEEGVGAERLVGLAVERSLELVVALLAVHKAGGAYLPLDPDHPAERLAATVADADPRVVLTFGERLDPSVVRERPFLDLAEGPEAGRSSERPEVSGSPSDLAYLQYTSGSTGVPKGVAIEQHSLSNFLRAMQEEPGLTADDVLFAVTSLSFDISALELFLPLVVGATVVVADRSTAEIAERLGAEIERVGATVLQSTPTRWKQLVASGWRAPRKIKALCGGEELTPSLARDLLADPRIELWNLYGPTETTIWSAVERVRDPDPPISIGSAIANTDLYVLDERLEPVPEGVPGELVVGGAGLARGYWNRPEKTATQFVPNPFAEGASERLYRTGDRVRRVPGGGLHFLGRFDQQIKLRGQRIELGEIESALRTAPAVSESVVSLRDLRGEQALVAHLVTRDGTLPDAAELRAHLAERIPSHMVPAAFVGIRDLPLTPNGKLDRASLQEPELDSPTAELQQPVGPTEIALAEIWTEHLDTEGVGRHQQFVDLGGHSLLAIRVLAEIEERLGATLRPGELLFGTLAEVADACDAQAGDSYSESWLKRVRRRLRG